MSMYGPQGPPYGAPQGPPPNAQGPGYGPPPGMGPPPKKKGMSTGCIIAIVVVVLFFGGIGVVMIAFGVFISRDKDVQNVFGALGEAAEMAAEAQSAPGTDELRALGCEQAMALDPAKLSKIGNRFMDGGTAPPIAPGIERMVMCQVGAFGVPPTCDDAARAYISGAAPTKNFMMSVQAKKRNHCSGVYSPTGVLVKPSGGAPGSVPGVAPSDDPLGL